MLVVSIYNHPTTGMFGRTDQTLEQAQTEAMQFVSENYPNQPVISPMTLTGWWLLKDDGRPFFRPKPWPLAFALFHEALIKEGGSIPKFMILLATRPDYFAFKNADTIEEAREFLDNISKNRFSIQPNPHGGLVATWRDPDQQEHTVSHVIAL